MAYTDDDSTVELPPLKPKRPYLPIVMEIVLGLIIAVLVILICIISTCSEHAHA